MRVSHIESKREYRIGGTESTITMKTAKRTAVENGKTDYALAKTNTTWAHDEQSMFSDTPYHD